MAQDSGTPGKLRDLFASRRPYRRDRPSPRNSRDRERHSAEQDEGKLAEHVMAPRRRICRRKKEKSALCLPQSPSRRRTGDAGRSPSRASRCYRRRGLRCHPSLVLTKGAWGASQPVNDCMLFEPAAAVEESAVASASADHKPHVKLPNVKPYLLSSGPAAQCIGERRHDAACRRRLWPDLALRPFGSDRANVDLTSVEDERNAARDRGRPA